MTLTIELQIEKLSYGELYSEGILYIGFVKLFCVLFICSGTFEGTLRISPI